MRVSLWYAWLALRMRVSMSAIGSVMVMVDLPARLHEAGDLARVGQLAQAVAAQPEALVDGARPPAALAAGVAAHAELLLAVGLGDEGFLGHGHALLNGKPRARSRARPESSSSAVVTMVMSMPRIRSILS